MPRPKKGEIEEQLRNARREGWVQAMLESGPQPTNEAQKEHFLTYYLARAEIVYP